MTQIKPFYKFLLLFVLGIFYVLPFKVEAAPCSVDTAGCQNVVTVICECGRGATANPGQYCGADINHGAGAVFSDRETCLNTLNTSIGGGVRNCPNITCGAVVTDGCRCGTSSVPTTATAGSVRSNYVCCASCNGGGGFIGPQEQCRNLMSTTSPTTPPETGGGGTTPTTPEAGEGGTTTAREGCDPNNPQYCNPLGETETIENALLRMVQAILGIIGTLALLILIVAGIMYITSAGDENRMKKAKAIISGTLIGLVIALLALSLLQVLVDILNPAGT